MTFNIDEEKKYKQRESRECQFFPCRKIMTTKFQKALGTQEAGIRKQKNKNGKHERIECEGNRNVFAVPFFMN